MTSSPEFLAIFFGFAAALSWGGGDFSGGLASRRSSPTWVIAISQGFGLVVNILIAILFKEPFPPLKDILIGAAVGLSGTLGLYTLYRGMATDRVGIIAPLAALISTIIPTILGLFVEGLPSSVKLVGFAFALISIWLFASFKGGSKVQFKALKYPFLAGLGFSGFYILVGMVSKSSVFWPFTATRLTYLILMLALAGFSKDRNFPARNQLPLLLLIGTLQTGGNLFFALATRLGRLDIASVLVSLYSGVTVLLARLVLKEQLTQKQWLGVSAALTALVLISI